MLTLRRPTIENILDKFGEDEELTDYYKESFYPDIEIKETKDEIVVQAELPGLNKSDIQVNYEEGDLVISGEKKYQQKDKDEIRHMIERRYGSFKRVLSIKEDYIEADKINAELKDGVLRIDIPKAEKKKPKQIEVR